MLGSAIKAKLGAAWAVASRIFGDKDIHIERREILSLLSGTYQEQRFNFSTNGLRKCENALIHTLNIVEKDARKSDIDITPFTGAMRVIAHAIGDYGATTFSADNTVAIPPALIKSAMDNRTCIEEFIMSQAQRELLYTYSVLQAAGMLRGLKEISIKHIGPTEETMLGQSAVAFAPRRKEPLYGDLTAYMESIDSVTVTRKWLAAHQPTLSRE